MCFVTKNHINSLFGLMVKSLCYTTPIINRSNSFFSRELQPGTVKIFYKLINFLTWRQDSIVGSVVECSPATRAARVRFPDDAVNFFETKAFSRNITSRSENKRSTWNLSMFFCHQSLGRGFWEEIRFEFTKLKKSPRRGIEPRSPAWQAGILTTILSRMR